MLRQIISSAVSVLITALILGCSSSGPSEIHYGQDLCEYCQMMIADKSFGSELVTTKGKIYKFDSIECLAAFHHNLAGQAPDSTSLWVSDFLHPGTFVRGDKATIVRSEKQKSPMGAGFVAFRSNENAKAFLADVGGTIITWSEICNTVTKEWKL